MLKTLIMNTSIILLQASLASANTAQISLNNPILPLFTGGNPEFFPSHEEPGPDAEIIDQVIHSKTIIAKGDDIKFKWTEVGYGALTYKVIIPSLAAHTLFDHRNPGEEGPCLRSMRRVIPGLDFEGSTPATQEVPSEIQIKIEAINQYRIDHEKGSCKVFMIEEVETIIGKEAFSHQYMKDMGFRLIDDCLIKAD